MNIIKSMRNIMHVQNIWYDHCTDTVACIFDTLLKAKPFMHVPDGLTHGSIDIHVHCILCKVDYNSTLLVLLVM